jgi:hypothetical protein
VNGILLQLVVFELPQIGKLRRKLTVAEEMMEKVLADEEAAKKGPVIRSQAQKRENIHLYDAPPVRIVAYDPKTKLRSILVVSPEAVLEIAGGGYSKYLAADKRRDLGRIICENLELIFPRSGGFHLVFPWAGLRDGPNNRVVTTNWRLSYEQSSLIRPGRIYKAALRVGRFNILVNAFCAAYPQNKTVTFNFRSSTCRNDVDIAVPESVQVEYSGQPLMSFIKGDTRDIAIRNFCRCFQAHISVDKGDYSLKVLAITLRPKKKWFIESYKDIGMPPPEEDVRAVGVPQVFMPPDASGILLNRRSVRLYIADTDCLSELEYVVSVFTKSIPTGPERGVVIKVYDPRISQTIVLHYGHNEVKRLCNQANLPDLLDRMIDARTVVFDGPRDELEEAFLEITEKGEVLEKMRGLTSKLSDIIIADVGIITNNQGEKSLYSKSSEYEPK